MSTIAIVTGCPGAGKTSYAREAARAHPHGLHLVADTFYDFPARLIDPTRPESATQNTAIIKALCQAAGSFARSGYCVLLDGIFGPWFLPTIAAELRPLGIATDYVVFRAEIDTALARVAARPDGGEPASVRHMNNAFRNLGVFEANVVDTTELCENEVRDRVRDLRASGALALDLEDLARRADPPS